MIGHDNFAFIINGDQIRGIRSSRSAEDPARNGFGRREANDTAMRLTGESYLIRLIFYLGFLVAAIFSPSELIVRAPGLWQELLAAFSCL